MNLEDDRPICDFCNLMIEEDESLEPIYVGEVDQPDPHRMKKIKQKSPTLSHRYERMSLLGTQVEAHAALYEALQSCPEIDVELHDRVRHVEGDVEFDHGMSVGEMSYSTDTDKVAARVTIEPKEVDHQPDAMFCPNCAEKFRNL